MEMKELEETVAALTSSLFRLERYCNAIETQLDFMTYELLKSHMEGLRFMEKENRAIKYATKGVNKYVYYE